MHWIDNKELFQKKYKKLSDIKDGKGSKEHGFLPGIHEKKQA